MSRIRCKGYLLTRAKSSQVAHQARGGQAVLALLLLHPRSRDGPDEPARGELPALHTRLLHERTLVSCPPARAAGRAVSQGRQRDRGLRGPQGSATACRFPRCAPAAPARRLLGLAPVSEPEPP